MKILHTSDWHLGQQFFDNERTVEHADMLRQITEIVKQETPDAMVVCGDVFHTGNPPTQAVEMYNRALLDMHTAYPEMQIVVTAGNHDSAARLVVNNELWKHFQVSIIGTVAKHQDEDRTPDYDRHIISIKRGGETIGFIAAVPHCYESNFPTDNPALQKTERAYAYFKGLMTRVKELNSTHLPVVLTAHMAVNGCDCAGHENIGGMDTREMDIFSDGYDYVALGHIHSPQDINDFIRYCGTPIPVNFGEKHEHSVSIVDIEAGKKPMVRKHKIVNKVPLIDFPTPLPRHDAKEEELKPEDRPLPFREVLERIRDFDDEKECYVRLVIKVDETMTPLANTLVHEAVKGKKCHVCRLQSFSYMKESISAETKVRKMTSHELRSKTPLEIAELFFAMRGIELTESQKEKIKEATIEAEQQKS